MLSPKTGAGRNLSILGGGDSSVRASRSGRGVPARRRACPQIPTARDVSGPAATVNNLGEVALARKRAGTIHVKLRERQMGRGAATLPASEMQMRATAVGIADLQVLEPKTDRADWLSFLGNRRRLRAMPCA